MDQLVKNATKTVTNDHPKDTDKHWHSVLHIGFTKVSDEGDEEGGEDVCIAPTLSVAFFKRIGPNAQRLGGAQQQVEDAFRTVLKQVRDSRSRTDFSSATATEGIKEKLHTDLYRRFPRQDIEFSVVSDVKWKRLVTDPTQEESSEWRLQGTFPDAEKVQTMSEDLQKALSGPGAYSVCIPEFRFAESTSASRKGNGGKEQTLQSASPGTRAVSSTRSAKRGPGTGGNPSSPHGSKRSRGPRGSG